MNIHIVYSIIALIAACVCGFITIPVVLDFCKQNGIYDIPNQRKIHKNAVPRLGGIVFLPSVLIGCVIAFLFARLQGTSTVTLSLWTIYFIFGVTAIYIIGFIDDLFDLNAVVKLVVQLIAASMLPLAGLWVNNLYGLFGIHEIPFYIGAPLTVVTVTFISNAINLIDGIDGLSGGLTVIILCGFAVSFAYWQLWYYVIIICALIGILIAYLYFNILGDEKKNRKIFMGDTGSLSIGFLLAFLSLKLVMKNSSVLQSSSDELLLAFSLLLVPTFDVFRVSLLRIRNGHSPMRADKNHIHHKLLRCGLSPHATLAAILCLALAFLAINYLMYQFASITAIVITDIAIYSAIHLAVNYSIKRRGGQPHVF
jgi:UDP-N-acetylmuramyl pentapeptide phosphotransferase/UDP-N-acetylglucosamine-1-phosphate transferase